MNEILNNSSISDNRLWEKVIRKYNKPDVKKSIWQIVNSFVPYVILWFIMYTSLQYSYALTLLLALIASGFLIRIFIIFHDCGHGSFFKSANANNFVGMIAGFLTFTPYKMWHHHHRIHHATAVNLDKRGIGDVWTMTKDEYLNAPKPARRYYRFFRNPLVMFIIGPLYVIFFQNRVTHKRMNREDRIHVYITNLAILLMSSGLILLMGWKAFLMIQLPVIFFSHSIGIWLFLIQHNFEDIDWERNENWDYKTAAFRGCSFLKLPRVFQWFTGNIGFHHIHHLSPRIPNYYLEKCHYENDLFKEIQPVYFLSTFRFLKLHLWDEANQKMIGFRSLQKSAALA